MEEPPRECAEKEGKKAKGRCSEILRGKLEEPKRFRKVRESREHAAFS